MDSSEMRVGKPATVVRTFHVEQELDDQMADEAHERGKDWSKTRIVNEAVRQWFGNGASVEEEPQVVAAPPVTDNRPKNVTCRHCGERFAGAKGASICAPCKSTGHTLLPAECPVCNEGVSI